MGAADRAGQLYIEGMSVKYCGPHYLDGARIGAFYNG
jgi:hypothetical protein